MHGFSILTKGRTLRQDICKVAFRMAMAKMVDEGRITADEAYEKQEDALFNIDAYNLTVSDDPIFWSVFGMNKREFNTNLGLSK